MLPMEGDNGEAIGLITREGGERDSMEAMEWKDLGLLVKVSFNVLCASHACKLCARRKVRVWRFGLFKGGFYRSCLDPKPRFP
jgi:hypothetical protein